MEYNKLIADFRDKDEVEGYYVLKVAAAKTTNGGKPFLHATLMDCSGTMEAKVWDYSGPVGNADEGKVVKIRGAVGMYRENLQVTIFRIRLATEEDPVVRENLVPTAPEPEAELWAWLQNTVNSMKDEEYRSVCLEMLRLHGENFRKIPAAKSVHHGFVHGLLMHTVSMMKTASFLADLYGDVVDRDLLLAGTLLHDVMKEKEFSLSQLGLATDYTTEGQLIGHLVMGATEVEEAAKRLRISEEKSILLRHMILSHHGEPEFGAAVRPQCAESELLSYIDLVDSRMEIYREVLPQVEPGQFSQKIFALDKKIYRHKA